MKKIQITKNTGKMLVATLLLGVMVMGRVACAGKSDGNDSTEGKEVVMTMMLGSEHDPNQKNEHDAVARFNEKFKGKYRIETEFIGSNSGEAMEKMKVLNSARALPAIVTNLEEDVGFAQQLASNGRLLNILPIYENDEEWRKYEMDINVKSSMALSGGDALYFVPLVFDSFVGFYYNKELLKKAGYDEFPEGSWEDFWKLCDDLVAVGITPLSMDTLGGAWCTMLTGTSVFGESEEGIQILNQLFPTDFNNEYMVVALENIVRMFEDYSMPDASGADYANAANHFFSENTAIIANGPWIIENFSDITYAAEGFENKVGYATYPGNVMITLNDLIGSQGISMDVSPEEQECAIEWFKFRATEDEIRRKALLAGSNNPKVPLTEDDLLDASPVMVEYNNAITRVKTPIPCFQTRWDAVTMYEVFAVELPNLISGNISVDEMIEKMNESATKYVAELEATK